MISPSDPIREATQTHYPRKDAQLVILSLLKQGSINLFMLNFFRNISLNSDDYKMSDSTEEKNRGNSLVSTTSEGRMRCELCCFPLTSFLEICKHLETEHQLDREAVNFLSYELHFNPFTAFREPEPDKRKFQCKQCERDFTSYIGMKQHNGKIHLTKYKDKKCTDCGTKFRHKYALKAHKQQVHENTTRVQCIHCNKTLYNKYHLRKHLMNCKMISLK